MKDKIWLKAMSFMAPTCHQRADRSFFYGNYQFPVCSRCQGVYVGYLIGLLFFIPELIILLPLTYIDGLIQLKTNYESTNFRRFTTGIITGIATIQLIKLIISTIIILIK